MNELQNDQTPLHIASRLGSTENVSLLLHHGASPDARTKDGYTPLHNAAASGKEDVLQLLLEHGASADVKNKVPAGSSLQKLRSGRAMPAISHCSNQLPW